MRTKKTATLSVVQGWQIGANGNMATLGGSPPGNLVAATGGVPGNLVTTCGGKAVRH